MNDPRLVRVLTALHCDTWLITPEMHRTLSDIVHDHVAGGERELAQHLKAAAMPANPAPRAFELQGRTAIIPVDGVIGRKFSNMLQESGVVSVDVLTRMLGAVKDDPEVDSVLMDFDSPGGTVMGIPEAAQAVRDLAAVKPVMAYINGRCCSAAYWLASQSSAIYATQSAEVGSIGAYLAVLDRTRQAELQGIRVDMFRSGPNKGMGYPGTSLTDDQRAMLQAGVDAIAAQFKAEVVNGRKRSIINGKNISISDEDMDGRTFDAKSVLRKFVDEVSDYGTALRHTPGLYEKKYGA